MGYQRGKIKIKKINDRDKNRPSKQEIKCECKSRGGNSFRRHMIADIEIRKDRWRV